jgi:hypothetical protein
MKNILVVLTLLLLPCIARAEFDQYGVAPSCDAQIIVTHKVNLTEKQWLEVIDVHEEIGMITARYAKELRGLIAEAYQAEDVAAWVITKCSK